MENKINIGELDTLVTIRKVVQTIGSEGQKQVTVSNYAQVWAKIERNISEFVGDGNYEAQNSITMTLYKIADLTSRWQAVIDGKTYEIKTIDPISRVSPLCQITLSAIN